MLIQISEERVIDTDEIESFHVLEEETYNPRTKKRGKKKVPAKTTISLKSGEKVTLNASLGDFVTFLNDTAGISVVNDPSLYEVVEEPAPTPDPTEDPWFTPPTPPRPTPPQPSGSQGGNPGGKPGGNPGGQPSGSQQPPSNPALIDPDHNFMGDPNAPT